MKKIENRKKHEKERMSILDWWNQRTDLWILSWNTLSAFCPIRHLYWS